MGKKRPIWRSALQSVVEDYPLVDSHCHLDGPEFDSDREQVIERAAQAGIAAMLAIGSGDGPPELDAGLRMASLRPQGTGPGPGPLGPTPRAGTGTPWPAIYATVGIHPHEAKRAGEEDYVRLQKLAEQADVLAVGEIGLDFHYDHSPRDAQERVFVDQMEVARTARKPIVIHCREAWPQCMDLLRTHWRSCGLGGVLHCFSGDAGVAREALDIGFFISFAGNLTFSKAEPLREVARQIPMDRLLVETDSPYLAPVPHRGKRNEPAFVGEVAKRLAELCGFPFPEIARRTTANFYKCFGLAPIRP